MVEVFSTTKDTRSQQARFEKMVFGARDSYTMLSDIIRERIPGIPSVKDLITRLKQERVGVIVATPGSDNWALLLWKHHTENPSAAAEAYLKLPHKERLADEQEYVPAYIIHVDTITDMRTTLELDPTNYQWIDDATVRFVMLFSSNENEFAHSYLLEETLHTMENVLGQNPEEVLIAETLNDAFQLMFWPEKTINLFSSGYTSWDPTQRFHLVHKYSDAGRLDPNYDMRFIIDRMQQQLDQNPERFIIDFFPNEKKPPTELTIHRFFNALREHSRFFKNPEEPLFATWTPSSLA